MKKLLLLSAACGLYAQANAQTPTKTATSLVHKITATWCNPCGSWGWTLANDLITATSGKALYMNLYASTSSSWNNTDFNNATAGTLATQFTLIGYPDFGNNAFSHTKPNYDASAGTINTAKVKTDIIDAVNAFALTEPVASSANVMSISGTTITVNAKAEFWSATSGEYYMAAYMIEDGALHSQNGQTTTSGTTSHHDVMRGSMTAASAWGEMIATGSIAAGSTYSKTYTFTVTDAKWDLSKMKVYTVLWKKVSGKYEYINVAETEEAGTAVATIVGMNSVQLSPNPAATSARLVLNTQKAMTLDLNVTDMTGRTVYSQPQQQVAAGTTELQIPVAQLATGIYNVQITANGGSMNQRLTVAH